MQHKERLQRFTEHIWEWYARHKRTLPWRDVKVADDTQRAYMILVSEVMLQQTQVPRVKVLFPRFLERFPTIENLARASNREVLLAWRGMGYNSRALRLRDAARRICAENAKCKMQNEKNMVGFPHSMEDLLSIPGIGPYTAAAIRNFAFGLPTPCIDTNIHRILHRIFLGSKSEGLHKPKRIYALAERTLKIALQTNAMSEGAGLVGPAPGGHHSGKGGSVGGTPLGGHPTTDWHSALMDFGSAVCTKRSPKCSQCPLSRGMCKSAFRAERVALRGSQRVMVRCESRVPRGTSHEPSRRSHLRVTRGGPKNEPGRMVSSRFVPNRIVRGKVVELLRDAPRSLTLEAIGRHVCLDWSREHRPWLQGILTGLCRDSLLKNRKRKYVLS